MKQSLLVSILAGSMFVITAGCDEKKDAAATTTTTTTTAAPAAAADKPAAAADKPAADAPAAAAAGGDIGVAECDDYIKKMAACMDKMPAASKTAMEQGFKASKDAWKQAAATPQGKDSLKTACKAAGDALASNPMCK